MASVDGEGKVCEREGSPLKELSKSFVVGACFFFSGMEFPVYFQTH